MLLHALCLQYPACGPVSDGESQIADAGHVAQVPDTWFGYTLNVPAEHYWHSPSESNFSFGMQLLTIITALKFETEAAPKFLPGIELIASVENDSETCEFG